MFGKVTVFTIKPDRLRNAINRLNKILDTIFWGLVTLFGIVEFWDIFFNGNRLLIKLIILSWRL